MLASWKLATIVDDVAAIKVAAAYYSLPESHRDDLDRLADASGIVRDISTILSRLEIAGVLGYADPPDELVRIIHAHCAAQARRFSK